MSFLKERKMKFYWALKLNIYTVYPIVHACMCV